MRSILALLFLSTFFINCKEENKELPYIGEKIEVDGETVYHKIPSWSFMNQDSVMVTDEDLSDYVYVTDFFFISCPTICPRVMKEMKKVYEAFEDDKRVKLVSWTIDPERDTPAELKEYATKLGVDTDKWWFLNGAKERTYDLANEYFIVAYEDASVPGGFDHSGKLILVDKDGHVRSFSEGTDPETTDDLIKDIKTLLASYE